MKDPTTILTPRYIIENDHGDYFDNFNQRKNAIKAAIKLSTEYPGNKFLVIKKVNKKNKIIFSFKVDSDFELNDIHDVYNGIVEAYKIKLDKIKYWRKSNIK